MTREAIGLNGDKVKFRIAELGIPRKKLLSGMNTKTLQRILRGERTSLSTAHQLARELGTTVDELKGPVTENNLTAWLSGNWLYEDGPAPKLEKHTSCMAFVGNGTMVMIDSPPTGFGNPFVKLLAFRPEICRKLVIRRVGETFEVEVHYFDYVNHGKEVAYQFGVSCRFFPLSRDGDNFLKRAMSDPLKRYFWTWLRETAIANAELLEIEGEQFPTHPHAYRPLVIFSKGHAEENEVGVRLFSQLQVDFRESLTEYLGSLDGRRHVFAQATRLGISITIEPTVKEMVELDRYSPTTIHVFLVWTTSTGSVRLAPWRYDHRQEFAAAIAERRWRDFYSRGMPIRQFPDDSTEDPPAPPMSADPNIPADLLTALRGIDWYDSDEQLWALRFID